LARLSGVSRFKICLFELGDGSLTADEQTRIRAVLQAEAERLRQISTHFEFDPPMAKAPTLDLAETPGRTEVEAAVRGPR